MINKVVTPDGIEILEINTPLCKASICLQGAHLVSWIPTNQQEVFFLSPRHQYQLGKAIRGGVPICWPWFGAKEGHSSHGIARNQNWICDRHKIDDYGNFILILSLSPADQTLPSAILRLSLGSELEMRLETIVRQESWTLSEAFHNYFLVGDYKSTRISGLEDTPFNEYSADATSHIEQPLEIAGPIDRIYDLDEDAGIIRLYDSILNRTIIIERNHSSSAIIWNPGSKLASQMPDLGDERSNEFICIETGNVTTKAIKLAPGQTHTLTQKISIS